MKVLDWLRGFTVDAVFIGLLVAAIVAGWTIQGWRKDASIATLEKDVAVSGQVAATARAEAAEKVLAAERLARDGIQSISDKLTRENEAAKNEKDAFIAGVRNGSIRLSVPVSVPVSSNTGSTDTGAAGGTGKEARAELTSTAAEFLDDIADEGDDAIRQSNAVIDAYNKVRESLNVQAGQP